MFQIIYLFIYFARYIQLQNIVFCWNFFLVEKYLKLFSAITKGEMLINRFGKTILVRAFHHIQSNLNYILKKFHRIYKFCEFQKDVGFICVSKLTEITKELTYIASQKLNFNAQCILELNFIKFYLQIVFMKSLILEGRVTCLIYDLKLCVTCMLVMCQILVCFTV